MNNYNYTIYAACRMVPNQYYVQDGTHKEYVKFFESELDCLRWCNQQEEKYSVESIWIEPDSGKILKEHILRSKVR